MHRIVFGLSQMCHHPPLFIYLHGLVTFVKQVSLFCQKNKNKIFAMLAHEKNCGYEIGGVYTSDND